MKIFNKEYKQFFKNVGAMGIVNASNAVIPILTTRYLIATIGAVNYGVSTFIQTTIQFLIVFVDFGFSLTGTKIYANTPKNKRSELFTNLYILKLILFLFIFVFFLCFYFIAKSIFFYDLTLFLAYMPFVLGYILTVDWFYRGINRLEYLASFSLASRVLYLIGIFIFVKSSNDLLLVLLINGVASTLIGMVASSIAFSKIGQLNIKDIKIHFMFKLLKKSVSNFSTNFLSNLYSKSHPFLIRQFLDEISYSYYSIAYKLVNAIYALFSAISHSSFTMAASFKNNIDRLKKFITKVAKYNFLLQSLAVMVIWVFGKVIISLLFGSNNLDVGNTYMYMRYLSLFLLPSSINTILNATFLIVTDRDSLATRNLFITLVIFLCYMFIWRILNLPSVILAFGLPFSEGVQAVINLFLYSNFIRNKEEVN